MDMMIEKAMRKTMREISKRPDGSGGPALGSEARLLARLFGPRRCWCDGEEGARRSVTVPVRMRASVLVIATIETCVAALVCFMSLFAEEEVLGG